MTNLNVAETWREADEWPHDLVETLIADSRDALIVVDRDQQVLAANAGWYLLCDEDPDVVLG